MSLMAQLQTVQRLAPLIFAERDRFDRERRLPATVVEAMHAANMFDLWVPRELGGPELSLTETFVLVEELSRLDGSVGWCCGIPSGVSRFAAFLPMHVAHRIFVDERAITAGAFAPTGTAIVEPGGYRVSGRWSYASGIEHSQYVAAACFVEDGGKRRLLENGTPEMRIAILPTGSVEIIDNWDVGGLRATGSHDFAVADVFVPEEYTLKGLGDKPTCSGPFYRIPVFSALPVPLAAVALGIASAAMDRFVVLATSKVASATSSILRENGVVQDTIARAEARLRAARAFVMEAMATLERVANQNESFLMHHRLSIRLACVEAVDAAKAATSMIHEVGGGSSVYESVGLQRCFRDMHAVSQHMQTHTTNYQFCGRVLLGLEPGTARF